MPSEYIGTIIKREREAQGLSQLKLCESICDIATLSRIENGQVTPSFSRLQALLQRLRLPTDLCRVVLSEKDLKLRSQMDEVRARSAHYFNAVPKDKSRCRAEVLEALQELETMADEEDKITFQYIEDERLNLGREDGTPYPPEERRARLLDILRITQPRFDPERITDFYYSIEETELINQIAITYVHQADHNKAVNMYSHLYQCLQRPGPALSPQYAGQFALICTGYAQELNVERHYEESIEIAQQGRRACIKYGRHYCLPMLLAVLANCHAHLGHEEESRDLYLCTAYLYRALEQWNNLGHLKNDARDTIGLELP